ncbi:MAG: ureE [Nitrososphaera sp.]|jgi:urease accessory protein|nr:ureE [Nitrososphaera sp.]MCY1154697.1 ureE [Nitrososphaera sp.]
MITINSIIGNLYHDSNLRKRYEEMSSQSLCESIRINRMEAQRVRMRKRSSKGTDIALTTTPGTRLRHGDVLMAGNDKMITIELEPENLAVVEVKDNIHEHDAVQVPVTIGHAIGNLHRPIKLEGRKIYFPIQTDSEIQMFKKIFGRLLDHLEITQAKMVFEPEEGTDVHEH